MNSQSNFINFCTECGEDLENFCFSIRSKDINAIKEQVDKCKTSKRFNGELCSKFFIVKEFDMDEMAFYDSEFDNEIE